MPQIILNAREAKKGKTRSVSLPPSSQAALLPHLWWPRNHELDTDASVTRIFVKEKKKKEQILRRNFKEVPIFFSCEPELEKQPELMDIVNNWSNVLVMFCYSSHAAMRSCPSPPSHPTLQEAEVSKKICSLSLVSFFVFVLTITKIL